MFQLLLGAVLAIAATPNATNDSNKDSKPTSVYDFTVKDIDGNDVALSKYRGKVLLIVNVASKCGLTESNYAGLNELHKRFADKGLVIFAFPANNFGGQEPGPNSEVKMFCESKNVEFPVFAKVSVKGEDMCPLYQFLTNYPDEKIAGEIPWNFNKYLVDREGKVVAKFHPRVNPTATELVSELEKALEHKH